MTSPQARFETSILATPEAISGLTGQVMEFLDAQGVEGRPTHHTALILEEILTNLATHGDCQDQPARIAVVVEPEKIAGEIVDTGPPFDPRLGPDPALNVAPGDRMLGGLGLYLVKRLSCALEYARRNDENYMTFAVSRGNASGEETSK
jgi:anti-sigma regulatory factor (Ser/Thr protein kinase)